MVGLKRSFEHLCVSCFFNGGGLSAPVRSACCTVKHLRVHAVGSVTGPFETSGRACTIHFTTSTRCKALVGHRGLSGTSGSNALLPLLLSLHLPPTDQTTSRVFPRLQPRTYSATKGTFRKDQHAKDNLYADLQVPSVCNNGSTMVRNKLCRPRQLSPPAYGAPSYGYSTTSFQPSSLERAEI